MGDMADYYMGFAFDEWCGPDYDTGWGYGWDREPRAPREMPRGYARPDHVAKPTDFKDCSNDKLTLDSKPLWG